MSGDEKTPAAGEPASGGDDQQPYEFGYNHARMPLFMKVVWTAFLVFATYYVVVYLLTSLGNELGG